jgi:small subunit ribosomal protein S15
MPLTKEKKQDVITQYGANAKNTGSIEGQIALLTERMNQIASHLSTNKKDFSTHRGLMQLVGKRKRLLNYLQKHDLTPCVWQHQAAAAGARRDRDVRQSLIV